MLENNEKQIKKENCESSQQEVNGYCVPYADINGVLRYEPCTEEFYKWYMNERRKEKHENAKRRRCLVCSDRYAGLVTCMKDCHNCPYKKQTREPMLSLESLEQAGYECADEDSIKDPRLYDLLNEISKLSENDQRIIKLFSEGYTDELIAEIIDSTRDAIKKRRQRLIDELKKKLKD